MTANLPIARDVLSRHGLPPSVLDAWDADGIQFLLPIQSLALDANILDGKSCIVIGPTSCGKTFIGEVTCIQHALARRRCLYLVPFKALAEEKFVDFSRKYARPEIGADILISTADRRDHDRRLVEGDFHIAILTYEKLSAMLVLHPGILTNAGAMIVDEIQMVSDYSRGAELELLLTRARQIAPDLQVVGLSAVVSDLNGFDDWLGAVVIHDDHRPVTLREGVLSPDGRFEYLEWIASERNPNSEKLVSLHGTNEEALAISLVTQLLQSESEQVLVFSHTVARTQGLARAIATSAKSLPSSVQVIRQLSDLEETETVSALTETLQRSVAFHNGDLTLDERLAVEDGFRSGQIRCVVATSTLSMGVNLPASTVVIVKPTKWTRDASSGWTEIPLSIAEYRNMSGRAGRFGLRTDAFGRAITIAKSPLDRQAILNTFVKASPGPIESAFSKRPLDALLLKVLASGLCNTADGSRRFILKTFAARHAWADEPSQKELERQIQSTVKRLQDNGLISIDASGKIVVTRIGTICASSGLAIQTFSEVLRCVQSSNVFVTDIAYLASSCADTGPDAVNFRFPTAEYEARTRTFINVVRSANVDAVGPLTDAMLDSLPPTNLPPYDQAKQIKYQAIALAYVAGNASRLIEDQMGISAGRARVIGSLCAWLCDTAAQIAWALGQIDEAKAYEVIGDRYRYGCTKEALLLAQVPHTLHRAEREQVLNAGFTTLQQIIDAPATEIARKAKVSRPRIETLQQSIVAVLGEALELERQQLGRLNAIGQSVAPLEAIYTLKGVALEQAVEDILRPPFCPLPVTRIASQREGEADLRIVLSSGQNGIAQVHAKDRPTDRVGIVKAGSILQQSPELNPQAFICFGRPDFMEDATKKAANHASNGRNYKLIPLFVLAELYVRFHESRITSERIAEILESETGYITLDRL